MIAFALISLFLIATVATVVSLVDSALRGRRAYHSLRQRSRNSEAYSPKVSIAFGPVSRPLGMPSAKVIPLGQTLAVKRPLRAAA